MRLGTKRVLVPKIYSPPCPPPVGYFADFAIKEAERVRTDCPEPNRFRAKRTVRIAATGTASACRLTGPSA